MCFTESVITYILVSRYECAARDGSTRAPAVAVNIISSWRCAPAALQLERVVRPVKCRVAAAMSNPYGTCTSLVRLCVCVCSVYASTNKVHSVRHCAIDFQPLCALFFCVVPRTLVSEKAPGWLTIRGDVESVWSSYFLRVHHSHCIQHYYYARFLAKDLSVTHRHGQQRRWVTRSEFVNNSHMLTQR